MGFVVALTRINWCGNDGDTPAPTWSVRMAKDDKSRKTNKMDKGCIYPGPRSDFASFCMHAVYRTLISVALQTRTVAISQRISHHSNLNIVWQRGLNVVIATTVQP